MVMKIKFWSCMMVMIISSPLLSQNQSITISGKTQDKGTNMPLSYVNIVLKTAADSAFVIGTISDENGLFKFSNVKPGDYLVNYSFIGYKNKLVPLYVGTLSDVLTLGTTALEADVENLNEVVIEAKQSMLNGALDKKTFTVADNLSQSGGSVLQSMQNLPGVTVQDGKVQLRGSDKVSILMDGKQSALTGFGTQNGLDNLPASAIEKIEIINNPSAKYDANGNAGIINIILKKQNQDGLNGKIGISTGVGSLWKRRSNLPTIRPQYQYTPKLNPSIALNYRKNKINAFVQADNLYTQTLNKNEFVTRTYNDGTVIHQQTKRNRNTNFLNTKAGVDWYINTNNTLTVSGAYGSEKIIDRGDQPFFNADYSERLRLWQFVEDEVKTTAMASADFNHQFTEPGHTLHASFNYTFHREDERYTFDNIYPSYTGRDAFKLLSDESVADLNLDYVRPLKKGKLETGLKFRRRTIPTNMQFFPGLNSPLDTNAGGKATYEESIPAVYGNYIYETKKIQAELGLRVEYVDLNYNVNPNHNTYKSDGYSYIQPFPNARVSYAVNESSKLSVFYNRRVDRPSEVDIRIFPKYDDAEIIKVGNPGLKPQFTNSLELGYKKSWVKSYYYAALYHRLSTGTITRISTSVSGSTLIYAVFQNVNKSYNSGVETIVSKTVNQWLSMSVNINAYHNQIDAFTIENKYPTPQTLRAGKQEIYTGNVKLNAQMKLSSKTNVQVSSIYLAPDIIPQGTIKSRFSVDFGIKKSIQNQRGELFLNATDVFNTLKIRQELVGNNFTYTSSNYSESQVFRIGYSYKF